jgi:hypothetical protein
MVVVVDHTHKANMEIIANHRQPYDQPILIVTLLVVVVVVVVVVGGCIDNCGQRTERRRTSRTTNVWCRIYIEGTIIVPGNIRVSVPPSSPPPAWIGISHTRSARWRKIERLLLPANFRAACHSGNW